MVEVWAAFGAAALSLFGSVVMALVSWGGRAEIALMRSEMATLKAEMRASIAESANTFYLSINGSYTKKDLYNTLVARVDGIENRVNDMGN